MPDLKSHVNFSSQIIGLFKKEYVQPFKDLLEEISKKYHFNLNQHTENVHLAVSLRCNDKIAMSVAKKPDYFNQNKNCDLSIIIIIPANDLIDWGAKLRKGQKKDVYFLKENSKSTHVETIKYEQFHSLEEYLTYCCHRILDILIQNDMVVSQAD